MSFSIVVPKLIAKIDLVKSFAPIIHIDFIDGKFKLPTDSESYIIDGMDCRGLSIKDISNKFPKLYSKIMEYRISCLWYENLEDDDKCG